MRSSLVPSALAAQQANGGWLFAKELQGIFANEHLRLLACSAVSRESVGAALWKELVVAQRAVLKQALANEARRPALAAPSSTNSAPAASSSTVTTARATPSHSPAVTARAVPRVQTSSATAVLPPAQTARASAEPLSAREQKAKTSCTPREKLPKGCELEPSAREASYLGMYYHASKLEVGEPKCNGSVRGFYLIGDSGSFQLDKFCFISDKLNRLRYSDNIEYIPAAEMERDEWKIVPQYCKLTGRRNEDDYDFRCQQAQGFTDVHLMATEDEWYDYYNVSVRSARGYETVRCVDDLDWSKFSLIALHSGIAASQSSSMLEFLEAERCKRQIRCLRPGNSTVDIAWCGADSGMVGRGRKRY